MTWPVLGDVLGCINPSAFLRDFKGLWPIQFMAPHEGYHNCNKIFNSSSWPVLGDMIGCINPSAFLSFLFFLLCLQSHHTYSMSMTKSRDIRYHMYDEYVIYVSMYDEYNLKYINRSKKHIFYVHKSFQTFYNHGSQVLSYWPEAHHFSKIIPHYQGWTKHS